MIRKTFCILLILAGSVLLGQDKATKTLNITVNAPSTSTGNLLTGMTPGNYKVPSGWKIQCLQDFETTLTTTCAGTGKKNYSDATWSTTFAYRGAHSAASNYGGVTGDHRQFLTTLPAGVIETYYSWYSRYDPQGQWSSDGGNFYEWEAHSPEGGNTLHIDWCCAADGWNATSAQLSFVPEGKGSPYINRGFGHRPIGFDGAWHQWEVHYKASTQTCATKDSHGGCPDGILQVWRDGVLLNQFVNVDLNGRINLAGMSTEIGGTLATLTELTNTSCQSGTTCSDGKPSCNTLFSNGGPFACASSQGQGYQCVNLSWKSWSSINAVTGCKNQYPLGHEFNKYVDDVIVLYR